MEVGGWVQVSLGIFFLKICIVSYPVTLLSTYSYWLRGFAKKKIQKIWDYYGSGWVGPGLTRIFFENPKIALNQ